jgi:hypothetical protein
LLDAPRKQLQVPPGRLQLFVRHLGKCSNERLGAPQPARLCCGPARARSTPSSTSKHTQAERTERSTDLSRRQVQGRLEPLWQPVSVPPRKAPAAASATHTSSSAGAPAAPAIFPFAAMMADAVVGRTVLVRRTVRFLERPLDNGHDRRWRLEVRAAPDDANGAQLARFVRKIDFQLHRTFDPPTESVCRTRYRLHTLAWPDRAPGLWTAQHGPRPPLRWSGRATRPLTLCCSFTFMGTPSRLVCRTTWTSAPTAYTPPPRPWYARLRGYAWVCVGMFTGVVHPPASRPFGIRQRRSASDCCPRRRTPLQARQLLPPQPSCPTGPTTRGRT